MKNKYKVADLARSILASMGLKLTRLSRMPAGVNLYLDLQRYVPSEEIGTIFDVGANVGQTSADFIHTFPKARIFAFEHIQETYQKLVNNMQRYPQVTCVNNALGEKEGTATVHLQPDSQCNSLNKPNNQPSELGTTEQVDITTILDFCRAKEIERIDLMKVDTGGYDAKVILGAGQMLRAGKIRFIFSEIGLDPNDQLHSNFIELANLLVRFKYAPVAIYDLDFPDRFTQLLEP